MARCYPSPTDLDWLGHHAAARGGGSSVDALMVLLAGVALVVALAGLLRAIRADRRVDGLERGWVRDRDYLNRQMAYESGRTLR